MFNKPTTFGDAIYSASETNTCPKCHRPVDISKKFCGRCGTLIGASDLPFGTSIDRWKLFGLLGSGLLVIGPFTPLISIPIMGSMNLMSGLGNSDGLVICGIAGLSFFLTLANKYWCLWISGLLGIAKVAHVFYFFNVQMPGLLRDYRKETAGNLFAGLGELAFGSIHMEWGVGVLALGTALSFIAAWMLRKNAAAPAQTDKGHGTISIVAICIVCLFAGVLAFFNKSNFGSSASSSTTPTNKNHYSETEAPLPSSPTSKWRSSTGNSNFDDSTAVHLALDANDNSEGRLLLRCSEGKTEAYIAISGIMNQFELEFGEYGSTTGITARTRYDLERAQTLKFDRSTDNQGAFFPKPIAAIRQMLKHDKLAFEYSGFQSGKHELIFDLHGLAEAVQPLQAACRWQ